MMLLKEKDRPKKERKKTSGQLQKILDALYSLYIRHKYSDENGYVSCYTCGKVKHYKELQCGHFISRKELATRYDERNTRVQCWGCNAKHLGNGMSVRFGEKLEQEYGKNIIQTLHKKAREITTNFPYEYWIEIYKEKLKKYV